MSNSSSTPARFSITRPAAIFLALSFIFGAMVLSASNIGSVSTRRPQVAVPATSAPVATAPADPLTDLKFSAYEAPGALLSAEVPESWERREAAGSGPLGFLLVPQGNSGTIGIQTAGVALAKIQGAPASATLRDYLRLTVEADKLTYDDAKVRDVKAGALSGVGLKQTAIKSKDPRSGEEVELDRDLWVLELDKANVLIVSAVAPTKDWAKMQAVLDRFAQSLKVDVEKSVAAITKEQK